MLAAQVALRVGGRGLLLGTDSDDSRFCETAGIGFTGVPL